MTKDWLKREEKFELVPLFSTIVDVFIQLKLVRTSDHQQLIILLSCPRSSLIRFQLYVRIRQMNNLIPVLVILGFKDTSEESL